MNQVSIQSVEHPHILLISYIFPPYPGIGGRRWAKHAKYLARKGYIVHVITASNPFETDSVWTNEVRGNNIRIYSLPPRYPSILLKHPTTVIQKIQYKFWDKLLPLLVRGSIYDTAIFWKKDMLSKAEEIIKKHQIKHVIATGAPFRVPFYALNLKKEIHGLKLMTDLRDPWTWGQAYGMNNLSVAGKRHELFMEEQVIKGSDIISVPSEKMVEYLEDKYERHSEKYFLLPHAYDVENVKHREPGKRERQLRLIYFGSQYDYVEDWWRELAHGFARASKKNFHLDVYSENKRYEYVFEDANVGNHVTFHPPIPSDQLFRDLPDYDFVLLVYPDYAKDHITTKFYEVIANKVPILLLGNSGYATRFLEKNNLGICFRPGTITENIITLLNGELSFIYNDSHDVSQYSFDAVTEKLISRLI